MKTPVISIIAPPVIEVSPLTSEELNDIRAFNDALYSLGFNMDCESYPEQDGCGTYFRPRGHEDATMVNLITASTNHNTYCGFPPSVLRKGAKVALLGTDAQGNDVWFTIQDMEYRSLKDWTDSLM